MNASCFENELEFLVIFTFKYLVSIMMLKPSCVTIQMKAIKQYFHVVLFIMSYKVVLIFKSVDEIQECDNSIESIELILQEVLFVFLLCIFS